MRNVKFKEERSVYFKDIDNSAYLGIIWDDEKSLVLNPASDEESQNLKLLNSELEVSIVNRIEKKNEYAAMVGGQGYPCFVFDDKVEAFNWLIN